MPQLNNLFSEQFPLKGVMFHMKPEPQSELGRWMRENRYSDQGFAAKVTEELCRLSGRERKVTGSAVGKWRSGQAMPRRLALKAIHNLTGIGPESFVEIGQIGDGT